MKKLFCGLLVIVTVTANAQFPFINLKNMTHNGVTDTVDNAPIVVDNGTNKVTVSGNKKITGSQYDATTAQQISNGVMTWTQSFNLSTQKCWVTASIIDSFGNTYITGGVATGTTNGVDLFVQCYDSGGSPVWTYTYNGPNSTMDVGTGLAWDGSNGIYVCGASDGTLTSLTDFVTIKLKSSSGTTMWTPADSRYNYSNSYDAATSIVYNSTTGYVEVTGPSGTTYTDWDIATVAYKSSSGTQQWVNRVANPGGNEDKAFGLATDTLGNVYAVGTTWNSNNGSYDISVQKLDTALNMVWIKSIDGDYNLDDAGFSLALDDSLNIYVAGTGYYQDTTLSNAILVKLDNSGNEIWKKKKRPPTSGSSAEGLKVKVKGMNEIFMGGNFTSSNQDIGFIRYNKSGAETMEKFYNGILNDKDKFLDLALGDSNYIYVSGRTYAGANLDSNIVLTYQYKDFVPTSTVATPGYHYIGNELIIGFNPSKLVMKNINDKDIMYGKLSDFVADSTCNKINAALGGASTYCQNFDTRKIFFDLNSNDTLSLTRLGTYVRVPKFYSNLLVSIPDTYTLLPARDSINKIKPDIYYACLNLILQPTGANDSLYPQQYALRSNSVYPNSDVNADSAWAITSGQPFVKIGVYDTGIDFSAPDFVGISKGGMNFVAGVPIDTTNYVDDCNHGTPVAGIIGARRNNTIGLAGIAGGDADSSKIGVSVYDCRILAGCGLGYGSALSVWMHALNTGVKGTNLGGMGLHLLTNSYFISNATADTMIYAPVQDQLQFANKNGVTFVASKWYYNPGYPLATFPADWNPEIVTCVGGSGNDGHYSLQGVNSGYSSSTGFNIDLVAPGSASLQISTMKNGVIPGYQHVQGNSFATPLVAGTMGLMMSYWNKPYNDWDNLVHNDCEEIVKMTATDLASGTYSETVGRDTMTGKGRLNTYKALKNINKHYYRIRHIDASHYSTSYTTTMTPVTGTIPVNWPAYNATGYTPSYVPLPINAGTYSTQIFEVKTTITYTLNPGEKIIGKWPFYPGCIGWSSNTVVPRPDRAYYTDTVSVTNTTAILKTYVWLNVNNGIYYPNTTTNIKSAITLYTYDSTGTVGSKELAIEHQEFKVHPNPSNDQFILTFYTEKYGLLNYQIFDILGREIKRDSFKTSFGKNTVSINFAGNYGMYILKVFDGNKRVYTQKLIKNE